MFVVHERDEAFSRLTVADIADVTDEPNLIASPTEVVAVGSPAFRNNQRAVLLIVRLAGNTLSAPLGKFVVGSL
jgi:hypothetical protein